MYILNSLQGICRAVLFGGLVLTQQGLALTSLSVPDLKPSPIRNTVQGRCGATKRAPARVLLPSPSYELKRCQK